MQSDDARRARLTGVPTTLYMRLHVHVDDLLRELSLIGMSDDYGLAPCWQAAWEQAAAAERAGHEHVDIELDLPGDTPARLSALFARADALAGVGLLLALDTPPELRQLREWLVDELARSLGDGDGAEA